MLLYRIYYYFIHSASVTVTTPTLSNAHHAVLNVHSVLARGHDCHSMSIWSTYISDNSTGQGSSNSLWTKWQDMQCVENCSDPDVRNQVLYEQPASSLRISAELGSSISRFGKRFKCLVWYPCLRVQSINGRHSRRDVLSVPFSPDWCSPVTCYLLRLPSCHIHVASIKASIPRF
jgi:hypothetical protein